MPEDNTHKDDPSIFQLDLYQYGVHGYADFTSNKVYATLNLKGALHTLPGNGVFYQSLYQAEEYFWHVLHVIGYPVDVGVSHILSKSGQWGKKIYLITHKENRTSDIFTCFRNP